jgi:lipocalin
MQIRDARGRKLLAVCLLSLLLAGCTGTPEGVRPVTGFQLNRYLWILARERQLPPAVLEDLLAKARKVGFATDALIFPGGAAP